MAMIESAIDTVFGSAVCAAPLYLIYQFGVYLLS